MNHDEGKALAGKVALVTGASRGAARAIAVELGRAGATVYVTGRSTRSKGAGSGRSTETVEETAELVTAAGGRGIPAVVDHLQAEQVQVLAERIDQEQGRLDTLIHAIWGAEHLVERGKKMWDCDLDNGLRMLRLGIETYYVTSHYLLPLLIRRPGGLVVELTDGTEEFNRDHYRAPFAFDLAKSAPFRMTWALSEELKEYGCTALGLAPGWMRTEAMLDAFHITEENWRATAARWTPRSPSPSPRSSPPGPSPHSLPTRTWPASPAVPCPSAHWPSSTASPTPTARPPTPSATSRTTCVPARHRTPTPTAERGPGNPARRRTSP